MEKLMEVSLLNHFVFDNELKSSCDFNPAILEAGPGIYEVIRVIKGIPLFLDEHIDRFYHSADLENYQLNFSAKDLRLKLKALVDANNLRIGNIRFQYIIHHKAGPVFLAWVTSALYPTDQDLIDGVELETLLASRLKPQSKRTNLPVRQMALEVIEKKGLTEVLLVNDDGFVTEGHRSNIFFIKDDTLYTSSVELVLPGITRDKIIRLAKTNDISVVETKIKATELSEYDASFLSSTSKNVLPVRRIDDIKYEAGNLLTSRLKSLFDELVVEYLQSFNWDLK